jgi:hypothetical protein
MSSPKKQTKLIRARKAKANKKNLKKNLKRIQDNSEMLRELASKQ